MKAIDQEGEAAESREYHTHDGDLEVRMDMTRELREMGLESDAIERILSIRIRSEDAAAKNPFAADRGQ